MKKKSLFFLLISVIGVLLFVLAFVLDGRVSDPLDGALMGAGSALTAAGISRWRFLRLEKKDPVKWKQYVVESRDERNTAIRFRARAMAGEALQWMLMAAAWVAILFDAPLWVTLAALGLFLFKTVLEMWLMARYQREM